jgi:hypothetical protein
MLKRPSSVASSWRYAEIFFRLASNVGFVDSEVVNNTFRGVPFIAIAPPETLRFGSLLRWAMPGVDAAQYLVDTGYATARRTLSRFTPEREAPISLPS